jgi:hypothetical protein
MRLLAVRTDLCQCSGAFKRRKRDWVHFPVMRPFHHAGADVGGT